MRLKLDMGRAGAYRSSEHGTQLNVCSYHLRKAGADAGNRSCLLALATGDCRAGRVESGPEQVPESDFETDRCAFLLRELLCGVSLQNLCKMRAFADLWEEIGREPLWRA